MDEESDAENQLLFSAARLWETAIQRGPGRDDFQVDPGMLRRSLIDNDYEEPRSREIMLLTSDAALARYAGPVRLI